MAIKWEGLKLTKSQRFMHDVAAETLKNYNLFAGSLDWDLADDCYKQGMTVRETAEQLNYAYQLALEKGERVKNGEEKRK